MRACLLSDNTPTIRVETRSSLQICSLQESSATRRLFREFFLDDNTLAKTRTPDPSDSISSTHLNVTRHSCLQNDLLPSDIKQNLRHTIRHPISNAYQRVVVHAINRHGWATQCQSLTPYFWVTMQEQPKRENRTHLALKSILTSKKDCCARVRT